MSLLTLEMMISIHRKWIVYKHKLWKGKNRNKMLVGIKEKDKELKDRLKNLIRRKIFRKKRFRRNNLSLRIKMIFLKNQKLKWRKKKNLRKRNKIAARRTEGKGNKQRKWKKWSAKKLHLRLITTYTCIQSWTKLVMTKISEEQQYTLLFKPISTPLFTLKDIKVDLVNAIKL